MAFDRSSSALLLLVIPAAALILTFSTGSGAGGADETFIRHDHDCVYEEFRDSEGRLHGQYQVWRNGVLVKKARYEHGYLIEGYEYTSEGKLRTRGYESRDYRLNWEYYDNDGRLVATLSP